MIVEGVESADGRLQDGASLSARVDRVSRHDALSLNSDETLLKRDDAPASGILKGFF